MPTRPNVTTPGGFFVGLGGIVCFSVVAAAVYFWVKSPATNGELRPQQIALGLRAADDATLADVKKKDDDAKELLDQAKARYNGGVSPDIDKLEDLRGVIRYREAQKSAADSGKALTGAVAWKDKAKGEVTMPIDLAMKFVANGLKDRKPKASAVKVDISLTLDPNAPPMLPNAMGGGAKTVTFPDPNAPAAPAPPAAAPAAAPTTPPTATPAAPAPASAPTAPPAAAPAPASGASAVTPPASVAASAPAPARPTLLNWPEPKK